MGLLASLPGPFCKSDAAPLRHTAADVPLSKPCKDVLVLISADPSVTGADEGARLKAKWVNCPRKRWKSFFTEMEMLTGRFIALT